MGERQEVRVPDIGDFDAVDVVEVLVKAGDRVEVEQSLITLESDKASMEVPSPVAGTVKEVKVSAGDQVGQDAVIAIVELAGGAEETGGADTESETAAEPEPATGDSRTEEEARTAEPAPDTAEPQSVQARADRFEEVRVPDIGDFDEVDVVEVLVSVGDTVELEQALITLESDKASMEVPSPLAGKVTEVKVSAGDKVGQDAVIAIIDIGEADHEHPEIETAAEQPPSEKPPSAVPPPGTVSSSPEASKPAARSPQPEAPPQDAHRSRGPIDEAAFRKAYASPAVRRFARELGVDLGQVSGSGRKGRILKEDVQGFVKQTLAKPSTGGGVGGFDWPQMPETDFAKFGPVETESLSRIQKVSAKNLHRSWLHVPHVTQHEEADVTEMEAFRKVSAQEAEKRGVKLTPVAFLLRAAAAALREYPRLNASLTADGESLVMKRYYHIGVAVDTPNGLVVPVIRDVDKKGLFELAEELGETSARMRDGKMKPQDFQGGSFTISSLGGIGGTAFTPIVNAPEVAILGVSRSRWQPVYQDGEFVPRLMLPLSLSYDHRVIDGAMACRFTVHLARLLGDIRRLLF